MNGNENNNILTHKESQEELIMNGKYKFSNESCSHFIISNLMCIFSCCDKQYPCTLCHNLNEKHESGECKQGYCKVCKFWDSNLGNNCKNCGVIFCDNEEVKKSLFWYV